MLRRGATLIATLLCSCEPELKSRGDASVRDKIVPIERTSGSSSQPRWVVTERLADSVLKTVGETEQGLDLPSVQSAVLTRTGFVATDGHRVFVFDSTARLLNAQGRDGEGPGEYRNLRSMCHTVGDSLVVFDVGSRRVSVLAHDGRFVRSFAVGIGAVPARNACFGDGTFIVHHYRSRTQFVAYRYALDGTLRDSSEVMNFDASRGGDQLLVESALAVFDSKILFGNPWDGIVQLHEQRSAEHLTLKLVGIDPGPITDDIVPYARPKYGNGMVVKAKSKNLPYFQRIRVSTDGSLWYNDYPRSKHEAVRWYGVTREGRRIGSVELDSNVIVNRSISLEDFGNASLLLRFEHDIRGAFFRIVPLSELQSPAGSK